MDGPKSGRYHKAMEPFQKSISILLTTDNLEMFLIGLDGAFWNMHKQISIDFEDESFPIHSACFMSCKNWTGHLSSYH